MTEDPNKYERIIPDFPIPDDCSQIDFLRRLCLEALDIKNCNDAAHRERLECELQRTAERGYANYFLLLWDLVKEVRMCGGLVATSWGGLDSSLISYLLDIAMFDPVKFGVIERFIDVYDDFIIIKGKGHKQRVVPITPILKKTLLRYETTAKRYFDLKGTDDYYFLSFHGRQLTNSAVEHIVKRHGAGVEGVRVSPHTCRHFFAQQQVKLGTDLYTISRLLGHENIGVTQTYLNSLRDEEVIQIAKQKSVLMNL